MPYFRDDLTDPELLGAMQKRDWGVLDEHMVRHVAFLAFRRKLARDALPATLQPMLDEISENHSRPSLNVGQFLVNRSEGRSIRKPISTRSVRSAGLSARPTEARSTRAI